jgi:hypothetical protein
MESSSYYKQKIDYFKELKKQLSGLNDYIDSCDTSLRKSKSYLDEVIICNESIDNGGLEDNAAVAIGNVSTTVTTLISECSTKINAYTDLYNRAYKAEQRRARLKKVFPWTSQ